MTLILRASTPFLVSLLIYSSFGNMWNKSEQIMSEGSYKVLFCHENPKNWLVGEGKNTYIKIFDGFFKYYNGNIISQIGQYIYNKTHENNHIFFIDSYHYCSFDVGIYKKTIFQFGTCAQNNKTIGLECHLQQQ